MHEEFRKFFKNFKGFFINYNNYYTDNFHKSRQEKLKSHFKTGKPGYFKHHANINCSRGLYYNKFDLDTVAGMVSTICTKTNADMEKFSCKKAIKCLLAIYKVNTFHIIENVTKFILIYFYK